MATQEKLPLTENQILDIHREYTTDPNSMWQLVMLLYAPGEMNEVYERVAFDEEAKQELGTGQSFAVISTAGKKGYNNTEPFGLGEYDSPWKAVSACYKAARAKNDSEYKKISEGKRVSRRRQKRSIWLVGRGETLKPGSHQSPS